MTIGLPEDPPFDPGTPILEGEQSDSGLDPEANDDSRGEAAQDALGVIRNVGVVDLQGLG